MKVANYRLGEYKIIEADTGELMWEAHFGLGALQEGRCFRKGAILFIGPAERRQNGFLKLEFVEHLKGFPDWAKTTYYCENLDVFHCKTGKKISREEMRLWMFDQGREGETTAYPDKHGDDSNDSSSLMSRENVDFRLQRYEINKKANGQVVWKTYAGPSSLRTGTCIVLEDILFIGPWRDEQTNLIKRQFLANLKQLPEWNQTKYYCPRFSLHDCKYVNRVLEKKRGWRRKRAAKEHKKIFSILIHLVLFAFLVWSSVAAANDHNRPKRDYKRYESRKEHYDYNDLKKRQTEKKDEGNAVTGQTAAWLLVAANLTVALSILMKGVSRYFPLESETKNSIKRYNQFQKKHLMRFHYLLNPLALCIAILHFLLSSCRKSSLPEAGLIFVTIMVFLG